MISSLPHSDNWVAGVCFCFVVVCLEVLMLFLGVSFCPLVCYFSPYFRREWVGNKSRSKRQSSPGVRVPSLLDLAEWEET